MNHSNFNKILTEKYFLLKDIAQKYNYSDELLNMMTFIYMSFYMDFGKKCDFPLYDLFNKVKIISGKGTVSEIAFQNGFGKIPNGSAAVTIFTPNLNIFRNTALKQNPQTIILGTHVGEYLATPALKLEMLTHEVRHALMGYFNSNILLNPNTYYMRSGLQETFYTKNDDFKEQLNVSKIGTILDEITNTYITEVLINRILSFKNHNITNNNLKFYLQSIKTNQPDGQYRALGYHSEVMLLYPLLLNELFLHVVNEHQFDGKLDEIKDLINSNTSLCDYQTLCSILDSIYKGNEKYPVEMKNNNIDFIKQHIADIQHVKSIILDINQNIKQKCLKK